VHGFVLVQVCFHDYNDKGGDSGWRVANGHLALCPISLTLAQSREINCAIIVLNYADFAISRLIMTGGILA